MRFWRGAAGVADVATGRPVTAGMRHRVGSITKTFTAAAVLQQVESGRIGLDTPIGRYLPRLVPGERGDAITVRMLINHTSGLAEYLPYAYPSLKAFPALAATGPQSLDDNQFTRFHPTELIEMGVTAPAVGAPGGTPGVYSNTNYLLLGELLQQVTGTTAERNITRNVIERAGLRDTAGAGPRSSRASMSRPRRAAAPDSSEGRPTAPGAREPLRVVQRFAVPGAVDHGEHPACFGELVDTA